MTLPDAIVNAWNLKDGNYQMTDMLYGLYTTDLVIENGVGRLAISLAPNASFILKLND
jgi:hypothetical protein